MSRSSKRMTKRAYHKQDTDSLNRVALLVGGTVAVIILVLIIGSQFI